jgi:transketolase
MNADRLTRNFEELERIREDLAARSIWMTTRAGSGHPSSALSASHIVTALYFAGIMRYDPQRPDWRERDRLILSKGHSAPILYAALARSGFFEAGLLRTLREAGSPLEGHPNTRRLAALDASTGSLGQGLSIGLGHALAARLSGLRYRVYVLLGDGELNEGQVWEAAMACAKYRVDNLTAIVDRNHYQQTGASDDVMPLEPLADKWLAFGWHVQEINGHVWQAVLDAFDRARGVNGKPQVIIANTVKGYQVALIEQDAGTKFHGVPLTREEADVAIQQIGGRVDG